MGKELHVGHLRSAVLGDTMSRVSYHVRVTTPRVDSTRPPTMMEQVLEFQGHSVDRVSHVGDMGMPVACMVAALADLEATRGVEVVAEGEAVEGTAGLHVLRIADLNQVYMQAKQRTDREPGFAAAVRRALEELQTRLAAAANGDDNSSVLRLWRVIGAVSRAGVEDVWRRLDVQVEERGESTYAHGLDSTVQVSLHLVHQRSSTVRCNTTSDMNTFHRSCKTVGLLPCLMAPWWCSLSHLGMPKCAASSWQCQCA